MSTIVTAETKLNPSPLTPEARYALLTRRQTLLTPPTGDAIKALLADTTRTPVLAWGAFLLLFCPSWRNYTDWETTAHIGYFIPIAKLTDFLRSGVSVKILVLSTYGHMINHPTIHPSQIAHRASYYKQLVRSILASLGIAPTQYTFVDETSYTFTREFMADMYSLIALMTQKDARDTGDEVGESEWLSPLLTPVLQTLSEVYLDMDIQFGGEDQARQLPPSQKEAPLTPPQRGLFTHSEIFLPQLNQRKRIHLMNCMLPSLLGGKMSSSHPPHTKIEFLDAPHIVRAKIFGAPCDPATLPPENGLLAVVRDVLWPISQQRWERARGEVGANAEEGSGVPVQRPFCDEGAPEGTLFSVPGDLHYASYPLLATDFAKGLVSPDALKTAIVDALNALLEPIRRAYAESEEWQQADRLAYPGEEPVELC
ncbi:MAG: hypothetical protein M1839_008401 [Geoglossum umbratile]|nr:MAG: hypothetical protein M1839_008401 [Geoglossum umbratile]